MNWDAIGAIGEIVGAAGVLFTLGFLAIQIRQNTSSIKAQSELELSLKIAEWHGRVTSNPELAALYEQAVSNSEAMSIEDAAKVLWHFAELFYIYEGIFFLYKKGDISKESWGTKMGAAKNLLKIEIIRKWWDARSAPLSEEFVDHINGLRGTEGRWNPVELDKTLTERDTSADET